jgi:cytochrome c oxidase subunit 3
MTQTTDPTTTAAAGAHADQAHDEHAHDPYLAHHFDTQTQQFESSKLGMWVFLATEILMFGGLFCAYAIYRGNHQAIFDYGHVFLDTTLGAINTVVLIASSFTMAWAVRAAQLGQQRLLIGLLTLTFLGGCGFMGIKAVEYGAKFSHSLWPGRANLFYPVQVSGNQKPNRLFDSNAEKIDALQSAVESHGNLSFLYSGMGAGFTPPEEPVKTKAGVKKLVESRPETEMARLAQLAEIAHLESLPQYHLRQGHGSAHAKTGSDHSGGAASHPESAKADSESGDQSEAPKPVVASEQTPNNGPTPRGTLASAPGSALSGLTEAAQQGGDPAAKAGGHKALLYENLPKAEQQRTHLFFQSYFLMTGLHGLHVLVGMGLIAYLILKAIPGHFGPKYFTPVDIIGLYWHLVDLIWIFLFPLLYLIG